VAIPAARYPPRTGPRRCADAAAGHACAEDEAVADRLGKLVREARLQGRRIHDANVAATRLVHGIPALVSDNPDDFAPFADVHTVAVDEAFPAIANLVPAGAGGTGA